jgi:hypothetical protein
MFFSKLWFFLVSLVAVLAVMLVLTQPRRWQRELDAQVRARLETAHPAARQLLQLHARKWLDAATQASQDAVLAEALDYAARETNDPGLLHHTVQERLQRFQEVWRANLVMALDVNGRVVGRVGFGEEEWGEDLSTYPAVGEALRGWRLDDTWELGGKLYRVCLAPIIGPSQRYVGALLVGLELGSELATVLREQLGLEVAFMVDGRISGQSSSLPQLSELPPLVAEQGKKLGPDEASGVLSLTSPGQGQGQGRRFGVVLLALGGEAAGQGAVCVLLGERGRMLTLLDQVRGLGWLQLRREELMVVAGGVGGALAIFFLLMAAEHHRRVRRLVADVERLRRGEVERIVEKRHGGTFRVLARSINQLGQLGSQGGNPAGAQSKDEVGEDAAAKAVAQPAAVTEQRTGPALPPSVNTRPGGAEVSGVAGPAGPAGPVGPARSGRSSRPPSMRTPGAGVNGSHPAPAVAAVTTGASMGGSAVASAARTPEAPPVRRIVVPGGSGSPGVAGAAEHPVAAAVAPRGHGSRVQRSAPRREVLASLAIGEALGLAEELEPGEMDYQAIYQEFVAAKRSLGESVEGLSFDRFAEKLRQNRSELIQRNSCTTVKFSVYIKDGRAAIRATPMYG